MNKVNDITQLKAEVLLNYLYPEMERDWIVDNKGAFYRNYNEDVLELYVNEKRVELSRDSFLKLLPQGILTSDDDLKKAKDIASKTKEIERRIHLLNEAFLPLDTWHFRKTLEIERQVAELLRDQVEHLLKEYFGFDLATEENPYVKRMAPMLPYAKRWRGDFSMLRKVMEMLFGCLVYMTTGRYSYTDSSLGWLPYLRYDLQIPDLNAENYKAKSKELQRFADFLCEWFIPAEMVCHVRIKDDSHHSSLISQPIVLDYNSHLS